MKTKICKKCGHKFHCTTKINGKTVRLFKRVFCLECSPYGEHNTRDLTEGNYGTQIIDGKKYKRCRECQNIKPFEEFYAKSEWGRYYAVCSSCNKVISKKRRDEFNKWCVEYKGGTCIVCGYNRCLRSLDFHHLDENQKDYGIAAIWKKSKEEVIKELDKCVLVCKNCHGEIHEGLIILNA